MLIANSAPHIVAGTREDELPNTSACTELIAVLGAAAEQTTRYRMTRNRYAVPDPMGFEHQAAAEYRLNAVLECGLLKAAPESLLDRAPMTSSMPNVDSLPFEAQSSWDG